MKQIIGRADWNRVGFSQCLVGALVIGVFGGGCVRFRALETETRFRQDEFASGTVAMAVFLGGYRLDKWSPDAAVWKEGLFKRYPEMELLPVANPDVSGTLLRLMVQEPSDRSQANIETAGIDFLVAIRIDSEVEFDVHESTEESYRHVPSDEDDEEEETKRTVTEYVTEGISRRRVTVRFLIYDVQRQSIAWMAEGEASKSSTCSRSSRTLHPSPCWRPPPPTQPVLDRVAGKLFRKLEKQARRRPQVPSDRN